MNNSATSLKIQNEYNSIIRDRVKAEKLSTSTFNLSSNSTYMLIFGILKEANFLGEVIYADAISI